MRRGDIFIASLSGDYGKPRPVMVVQSDRYAEHPSVTVLPLTSTLRDAPLFRVTIEPAAGTGLQRRSQVMVDKAVTIRRDRIGEPIGRADASEMAQIDHVIAGFLGLD